MDNVFYTFGFEKWVLRKLGCAFFCLILVQCLAAKNLFLVSATIGKGAIVRTANGSTNLEHATYLPLGDRVAVGPRSGMEVLASSRTLRFGAQTTFTAEEERLVVYEGALLYRTRKMGSVLTVNGPEVEVSLDGMGTLLLEVEPNGGFKLVGLLGRLRITNQLANRATQLLPGELLFVKPGGHGFGDKVFINLKKLTESSFLVSGFDNLTSFERSLASVAHAQDDSIAKRYRAEVGKARGVNTFEVIPISSLAEENLKPKYSISKSIPDPKTEINTDAAGPLEELLGRPAKRLPSRPFSEASSPRPAPPVPPRQVKSADVSPAKKRLPGRLFESP